MRIIFRKFFCDDELGEADAFYEEVDDKLQLITAWSTNDAHFRPEYMMPLFQHLGIAIKDLPKRHNKAAKELLCDFWGV